LNRPYETTFIADAHLSNEQIETVISKFTKIITNNGGEIKFIDRWGKRRLAYEIAKKQYGFYVYLRFDAEGSIVKILDREYRLDDNIIRYLTIVLPRIVVENEGEFPKTGEQAPEQQGISLTEEGSESAGLDPDGRTGASEDFPEAEIDKE
jgi:small subunit ribosomal protein S6